MTQITVKAVAKSGKGFMDQNEKWYNSDKSVSIDLSTLKPGYVVEVDSNERGFIKELKVVSDKAEVSVKKPYTPHSGHENPSKSAEIARSTAVKAVLGSVALMDGTASPEQNFALSKDLVESYTKYILSGAF